MSRGRPILLVNINLSPRVSAGCRAIVDALGALAPSVRVEVAHWRDVDAARIRSLRPAGMILGPNGTPFPAYPASFDDFLSLVRARRALTLGICGGHQALAIAHGAPVGPVMDVPAARTSYKGMPKIKGAVGVRLLGDHDPLMLGLPDELLVAASHVDMIKEVPPGFRLLGVGDPCHIQVIRADSRPVYGVQFHPERPAAGDHGTRILANFLRLAGHGAALVEEESTPSAQERR